MTDQQRADRRQVNRLVAGQMAEVVRHAVDAQRALGVPPTREALLVALENSKAMVVLLTDMIDAHDAVMLRIMLP